MSVGLIIGIVAGLLILAVLAILLFPVFAVVFMGSSMMNIGTKYMDSLTPDDIQSWIDRAEKYLAENDGESVSIDEDDLPEDLRELKIVEVLVLRRGSVAFKWLGGIDHTALWIKRNPAGGHTVTAQYNDYRSRQLYPVEEPNQ